MALKALIRREGKKMEVEYYKVSGRFEVYSRHGMLITNQLFVNKIFGVQFPAAAKNMAIAYAKRRATKGYGKGTLVKQASNLVVRKSHKPLRKIRKQAKNAQPKLF